MLSAIKKKIIISKNKTNIAKISMGTLSGQLISIITLPIITRLYGPGIIGTWALLVSISVIINSFSDLGLINSIMIEDESDVEKNYKVISTLSIIISILAGILVTFFYTIFFKQLEMNTLLFFILLTTNVFLLQHMQICYTWHNRIGNYNILMKNPLINSGIYGIFAIILGLFGFITYGLFIAHIVGEVFALLNLKRNLPKVMFTFNLQDFRDIIKKNKKFVIYQTPTNMISRFATQLPSLLIVIFWDTVILGYYAITLKLLNIPITLLASAIGRVFFQITSAMKREGRDIGQFVYKNINRAMKMGIIPVSLLIAFGDVAAIIILGEEWIIAGNFVRILALQYYITFIMTTVQGLSITLEKQNYAIVSSVSQVAGFILGTVLGKYVFQNIYAALILMSLFFITIQTVYFCFLLKVMNLSRKKYVINVLVNILIIVILSYVIRTLFNYLGIINFIYILFGRVL